MKNIRHKGFRLSHIESISAHHEKVVVHFYRNGKNSVMVEATLDANDIGYIVAAGRSIADNATRRAMCERKFLGEAS